MNNKLILWSITVGLGGFLFGLDTAVISGAELEIQKLWNLDSWTHGLAVAIALYGTVIGAAFGGIPADKLRQGRERDASAVSQFDQAVACGIVNHSSFLHEGFFLDK